MIDILRHTRISCGSKNFLVVYLSWEIRCPIVRFRTSEVFLRSILTYPQYIYHSAKRKMICSLEDSAPILHTPYLLTYSILYWTSISGNFLIPNSLVRFSTNLISRSYRGSEITSTRTEKRTSPKEEVDARNLSTDPTSNGDSNHLGDHNDIAAGEKPIEIFYLEGWQLWGVMCTLYLNTLLAALDVVSIPINICLICLSF